MNFLGLDCPDKGLVLIVGRPGIGKTTQIIKFIETSLPKEQDKIAIILRKQNNYDALNQRLLPCDKTYYEFLNDKNDIYKTYVNDLNNIDEFISTLKNIIMNRNPKYIFIDTIREQNSNSVSNKTETLFINALIELCKQKDVLIFVECIPKRSLERRKDKRPNKNDLTFSDTVISKIDKIIYLYRNDYYDLNLPFENCVVFD